MVGFFCCCEFWMANIWQIIAWQQQQKNNCLKSIELIIEKKLEKTNKIVQWYWSTFEGKLNCKNND